MSESTAITTPEHLKRWLNASGRRYVVFRADDLVDALTWPDGVNLLLQVVSEYRRHRRTQQSGRLEQLKDPATGVTRDVPVQKGDGLEADELRECIEQLQAELLKSGPAPTAANR